MEWCSGGQTGDSLAKSGGLHKYRTELEELPIQRLTAQMGAYHRELDPFVRVRKRFAEKFPGDPHQLCFSPGRANERYPEWQTIRPESGGNARPAKIHEIYEIRIATQVGIELHGIRKHLLDAINRSGCRAAASASHSGPEWLGKTNQLRQPVGRLERLRRREVSSAFHDAAYLRDALLPHGLP